MISPLHLGQAIYKCEVGKNQKRLQNFPIFLYTRTKYFLQLIQRNRKMIWCHLCQSETEMSVYTPVCSKCGSQAIERASSDQPQPSDFRPYVIEQERRPQPISQPMQPENQDASEEPVTIEIRTVVLEDMLHPGHFSVIRYVIIHRLGHEQKKRVDEETFGRLKRVRHVEECAICQDSGNEEGVKLDCSHNFHQKCIRPWFEENNTCPCCRSQIF